ncbi:hypothetical protein [Streptomyces sp. NPDC057002]|uniref:DUF7715 family protein n=1 Tax=Streptomyces sp. NPDC057002 TaxID=3345992 RepID=UPI003627E5F1
MKFVVPASDEMYRKSDTAYSWTDAGEILSIGTDSTFVGISSGRHTTRGKVVDLNTAREDVTEKVIELLTRQGWYDPHRETQSTECQKRMREPFGLARGFNVGVALEIHEGRPRLHQPEA